MSEIPQIQSERDEVIQIREVIFDACNLAAGGARLTEQIDSATVEIIRRVVLPLREELNRVRANCHQHRLYAHMMQEQRSEIARHCNVLEAQLAAAREWEPKA